MFYQLQADEIQALCGDFLSIEFILGIKAEMCSNLKGISLSLRYVFHLCRKIKFQN